MLVGGIEAGGTKFVCAVTDGKNGKQERISMPTETPEQASNTAMPARQPISISR